MRADLIALTQTRDDTIAAAVGGFNRDPTASDAEHLIETGGRLCYRSFHRPGSATAGNADYIRHILEVAHGSVLEHGVATFLIQGVSRSLTHELVRHRHLSPSQQSQRYVDESQAGMVRPPIIDEAGLTDVFEHAVEAARHAYRELVDGLTGYLEGQHPDWPKTERRKAARQAARSVMPNATHTAVQLTGNFRAWRHFLNMRATRHADVEIRALAIAVLRELQAAAPHVFGDYTITTLDGGSEVATSPLPGGNA